MTEKAKQRSYTESDFHITHLPHLDSAELFSSIVDEPWAMFFDSGALVHDGEPSSWARFDVLAMCPDSTLVFNGEVTQYRLGGNDLRLYGDPLALLQTAIPDCESSIKGAYLPGAYGYFSYDLARQFEAIPNLADDDENLPQMAMGIYSVILVVDHKRRKSKLIRLGDSPTSVELEARWLKLVLEHQEELLEREVELIQGFDALPTLEPENFTLGATDLNESLNWDQYQLAFAKVRQYTKNGDCYQVNLTKRFEAETETDAWDAYRSLRTNSPAPYGCFMNLPFAQILSNSPERFVQCRDNKVKTSPIKGTRARNHDDPVLDREIAEELKVSEKDRAENLMIVDLMRNDLSRACELGSVKVPNLFALHSFANVHHLISTVTGVLRNGLHALDLLRCCFPGGSITGAPKIRSMEIIEELEPTRRGLYCGAVGYIGVDGNMETNIAIRTIVIKDGVARFSAGGGLVIDSDVEDEYQELIDKASMMTATVLGN
ncbi:aminodeoxychorismate synthase component I [Arenicella sp. 4NH20-0111]|uniref:aminodeoxychorismate synthase component I n=1 Tax=Arenicella sp. 4NH20-0111 TaxID=3127648 RepID=UPI003341B5B3